MGCELGLFFNAVCPGIVKGFVLLDVAIPLYTIHVYDHNKHFESFYQNYYDEYKKQNVDDRVYTKRKAKDAVMVARKLTDEQAELVLSRNLVKIGDDQYRLSWDRRLRFPATTNYPVEYNYQIFKHLPPTIIFKARLSTGYLPGKPHTDRLISELKKFCVDLQTFTVEGYHDVHLTHPSRVAPQIIQFLNKNFHRRKSKI
ncbi:uncharacterized protein ACR2FA_009144 [Aphomia sociella]